MLDQALTKKRVQLFGIAIDALTMQETVNIIFDWLRQPARLCKFVITPNVDHVVQVQTHAGLRSAYEQAALVVTDGRPVYWSANWLGVPIPETVPGSDLAPAIFDYAQTHQQAIKVFLLGAMPGVADRARQVMAQQWPIIEVVGTLSPNFGFDKDAAASKAICDTVNASGAELLLIGLGAPKQELWVNQYAGQLSVKAALCIGATIDFIAGEKPRAPVWMRKLGLEWLHRMCSEPKRLVKRYYIDAIKFPPIIYREWRLQQQLKKIQASD